MNLFGRLFKRKRGKPAPVLPVAGMSPEDKARLRRRSAAVEAYDALPEEIRAAIRACDFPVDIQRLPPGFGWRKAKVVERIQAIKTNQDAVEFDKWLLQAGLRYKR